MKIVKFGKKADKERKEEDVKSIQKTSKYVLFYLDAERKEFMVAYHNMDARDLCLAGATITNFGLDEEAEVL